MHRTILAALFVVLASALHADRAQAAVVSWQIDSSQSYIRMSIPDYIPPIEGAPIRFRNYGNTANWVDSGGRFAPIGGTFDTAYYPYGGDSIEFLGDSTNIYAIDTHTARPNPNAFDPNATDASNPDGQYADTSSALADFAGRMRTTVTLLQADAAFFALRDTLFRIDSPPLVGIVDGEGAFGPGSTTMGIAQTQVSVDGLSVLGAQIFADRNEMVTDLQATNGGGLTLVSNGVVEPSGLVELQLTYNVDFSIPLHDLISDYPISTTMVTMTGLVVAKTYIFEIPEPSSLAMAAIGGLGIAWQVVRRRSRKG